MSESVNKILDVSVYKPHCIVQMYGYIC